MRRVTLVAALMLGPLGCTTVTHTALPGRGGRELFVTTGDVTRPYRSLGLLQTTRKGVLVFGFLDPAGTDLRAAVSDLVSEAHQLGGDGVINVRFDQTQYLLPTRILAALLFFLPLPSEVTVTGEVIRFEARR